MNSFNKVEEEYLMLRIICNNDLDFLNYISIFEDKSIVFSSYKVLEETVCETYPITKIKHSHLVPELIDETIEAVGLYKLNLFDTEILTVIKELIKRNKKVVILL